jgi:RNA-directed DNA polymerase
LEKEVKPLVEQFLRERGLELSQEKTHVTHIEEGFDFLGQNIRKYDGKLLIKPSKKAVQTHLSKIRGIIKDNKTATAGDLIMKLNPIIRGWANYHHHVVSSETFSKVDYAIFKALWRWAKRRHPNKGKKWIKEKILPNQRQPPVGVLRAVCRQRRHQRSEPSQYKQHPHPKASENSK